MFDRRPASGRSAQRVRSRAGSGLQWVSRAGLLCYVAVALLGAVGWLPDYQIRVAAPYQPPEWSAPLLLGSDMFGRSVLYKLLSGTQIALGIGLLVPSIAIPLGFALGAIAGYYGRALDLSVVWLTTVVAALPDILIVLALSFVLGKGVLAISVAMASVGWVSLCRLVRAEFIKHRDREYVLAARLLGAGDLRLIVRHILPNVWHLGLVSVSLQAMTAIKFEVVLTYLGVGVQEGSSWGLMIADATGELVHGVWWPLAGVTGAMFGLLYGLNSLSDAARDALDR